MKEFLGESLGTFILTLFGCGSVAVAILFGEYVSIFQIAIVWGLGITLAIYLTRFLCGAHLNPAVSIAMVFSRRSTTIVQSRQSPLLLFRRYRDGTILGEQIVI